MTEDQDEINVLVVDGSEGNEFDNLRDNLAWPQPGYDNWPPTDTGWVLLVDDSNKITSSLDHEIKLIPQERVFYAFIAKSNNPNPDTDGNNDFEIIFTPTEIEIGWV